MKTGSLIKLSSLLFAVGVVWYSFYVIAPPAVKPSSAPSTDFSAERSFEHVKKMATAPRPLGSAANDSARAYLMAQLENLGLNPYIQRGVGLSHRFGVAGYVRNIIAELPGQNPRKTILLMAHYDSVPIGPGAGDDASGVSAILETLRAIKTGEPLQNDILVLLTDGEERGLLGAELFANQYAELEKIDLVINVEARGTAGSSIMFETSLNNAELISHFAQATSNPVANSMTYTVYKLLPNDTDLSVTKKAGLSGLNYAFIDGFLNYHTRQDNPENLSLRSLQHHGENLLANIRYFGSNDFELESHSEMVYFNNPTGGLALYPSSWSFSLSVILGMIYAVFLVFLFRNKSLQPVRVLLGIFSYILLLITGALITYYGWQAILWIHPDYRWLLHGDTYNHEWYLYGFAALMLALTLSTTTWLKRKIGMDNLLAGVYFVWIVIHFAIAWFLPTASYLFLWPVLFGLLGWIALGTGVDELQWKTSLLLCISLFPALFIIPPYIRLIQVSLSTEMLAASMILLLFLAGLCLPLLWQISKARTGYWTSGLAGLFLFCIVGAAVNAGYDSEHKKQNHLMYLADLDRGKAWWLSNNRKTDSWTDQFFDSPSPANADLPFFGHPLRPTPRLISKASVIPFDSALVQVQSNSIVDSLRHVSLRIRSREPGSGVHLKLTDGNSFKRISIHNTNIPVPADGESTSFSSDRLIYFADITEPAEMELVIANRDSVGIEITFIRDELPVGLIQKYESRKPWMMPASYELSDVTLWKKTFWLESLDKVAKR